MKFWFVCLVVVFGIAELYQWFQSLTLPMPFYGAAGLLLALVSNSNQWMPYLPEVTSSKLEALPQTEFTTASSEIASEETVQLPPALHSLQTQTQSEPQLPNLPVAAPPPISFTIQKP